MSCGKTLIGVSRAEIVIKKSRFIADCSHVENEAEASAFIAGKRAEHRDARHVAYAYRIGSSASMSDDGEPQGTAGIPLLDLLTKREITDCVVTVTRYFGGILLGAPGLVRAYSGAAKDALDVALVGVYNNIAVCAAECGYPDYEKLKNILSRSGCLDITPLFSDSVSLTFICPDDDAERVFSAVAETFSGRITPAVKSRKKMAVPLNGG